MQSSTRAMRIVIASSWICVSGCETIPAMFEADDDGDPLTSALSSRRIPHARFGSSKASNRGKGKSKGNSGRSVAFDPLRALGRYKVQLGSSSKRAGQTFQESDASSSWLEIHELTEDDDGFLGTFHLCEKNGSVSGMSVLAGSRKTLDKIIDGLENAQDEETSDSQNEGDGGSNDKCDMGAVPGEDESDGHEQDNQKSALEVADEKHNKRIRAFEKNTFRNPKFWMRWKGHISSGGDGSLLPVDLSARATPSKTIVETNQSYIIFASNSCDKFEGTFTCQALGWDNVKVYGWKTASRPSSCPLVWLDFGSEQSQPLHA